MLGSSTSAGPAAPGAGENQSSSPAASYKCTTCIVSFKHSGTHRDHMRSDWHVYNLKRRIASLPPISSSIFEEQVVPALEKEEEESSFREACTICGGVYYSKRAYENHFRTQNHARKAVPGVDTPSPFGSRDDGLDTGMNALSLEDSRREMADAKQEMLEAEEVDEEGEDEFMACTCLFCHTLSTSMGDNLSHMQKAHGLFIPDPEHVIDTESFLGYLYTIINDFQECLYCSITKSTTEAIQHHMRDRGHCKINFDDGSEYRLFYDYSVSASGSDSESEFGTEARGGADGTGIDPLGKSITGHITARNALLLSTTSARNEDLYLPSGKVLSHRASSTRPHRTHRHHHANNSSTNSLAAPLSTENPSLDPRHDPASTSPPEATSPDNTISINKHPSQPLQPPKQKGQQLTIRKTDQLSLAGIPVYQQRALRAVEKMHLRAERRAREAYVGGGYREGGIGRSFLSPMFRDRSLADFEV